MKRTPIKRKRLKPRRGRKDPAYLEYIRSRACVVCKAKVKNFWLVPQDSPTEAAHVGLRGLGQKCSDREAIPLCATHHRTGKDAQHVAGRNFWKIHGLDKAEIIARLNALYEDESR